MDVRKLLYVPPDSRKFTSLHERITVARNPPLGAPHQLLRARQHLRILLALPERIRDISHCYRQKGSGPGSVKDQTTNVYGLCPE